jgi:thiol-disulfide isomerase/thioredoxin
MKKLTAAVLILALILTAAGCALLNILPASSTQSPAASAVDVTPVITPSPSVSPSPTEIPASDGIMGDFEATDLAGNTVDQSIFSGYALTMVNIWATSCGPCINEMPELGALDRNYAEKGFQIVGIVSDAFYGDSVDTGVINAAEVISEQTGADYLHIVPSEDLLDGFLDEVMYVPTTIFVDETGTQVGEEYVGAKSYEEWAKIADELLEEVG